MSAHGRNWQGLGNYGIKDLLVKIQEMGKKIYLFVLSGTEVMEGGPVSIVNSQKTLLSQFGNRELYCKTLTNLVGFPFPFYHKEPHTRRDTVDQPLACIMKDGKLEATLTASQNHKNRATKGVIRQVVQRSQTYDIFTESY